MVDQRPSRSPPPHPIPPIAVVAPTSVHDDGGSTTKSLTAVAAHRSSQPPALHPSPRRPLRLQAMARRHIAAPSRAPGRRRRKRERHPHRAVCFTDVAPLESRLTSAATPPDRAPPPPSWPASGSGGGEAEGAGRGSGGALGFGERPSLYYVVPTNIELYLGDLIPLT